MEIREWLVELRRTTHSDLDSELMQRWLALAENYSTKLPAAATQLPASEIEPTWENQRKYNAAGS
jgi:hypothetical protein